MSLRIYNTASRSIETFAPEHPPVVTMYNCGPTVYNFVHIGNLRPYVFADVLRRILEHEGFVVKQVVNITDVGHLVSDGDEGEDKMEVGARRDGASVEAIIDRYSSAYFNDLEALNIKKALSYPRATQYIVEQKELIETLAQKGFTYTTNDGIYFDTSLFPRYADFARLDISGIQAGARVDMGEKKHATDFALWKFSPVGGAKREQEWDSPLGSDRKGFPGWHIECSAIAMKELGASIDIHTGGIDHIPVHHTNEIAQSECATGTQFVHYWMHIAHMLVDGDKMSKSLGNTYTLTDLHERGIPPLAYRYWLLTAHYRTQINFTWEALAGAQSAYNRLTNFIIEHKDENGVPNDSYIKKLMAMLDDDLNTAGAVALIWTLIKDDTISDADKYATLLVYSTLLGLGLEKAKSQTHKALSPEVQKLVEERKVAREQKNWNEADRLRELLREHEIIVKDTADGQEISDAPRA